MITSIIRMEEVQRKMMSGEFGENPGEAAACFGISTVPGCLWPSYLQWHLSLMKLGSRGAIWSQGLAGQGPAAPDLILGAKERTLEITSAFSFWGLAHSHTVWICCDLWKRLPVGKM